jgi:transcriptional regulator with XRE-family HTH domain
MKPEEAFGIVVKDFRLERNMSQELLAEKSNLDRTFISMLERGKRVPTISTVIKIAKAFEVTSSVMMNHVETLLKESTSEDY